MTYITQLTSRPAMLTSRILTMMLAGMLLVMLHSSAIQAQWTTPNAQGNINNTNTGKVGVGGTGPVTPLEVYGPVIPSFTGNTRGTFSVGVSGTPANLSFRAIDFLYSDSYGPAARIAMRYDASLGSFLHFGTSNNTLSGVTNSALVIDPNGKVGIGTTNPTRMLEVLATDGEALRLYRNSSNVGWGVNLKFALNNSNGAEVDYAGLHGVTGTTTAGAEAGHIVFTTVTSGSLTEKMRLTSGGSLGLGTSTPGYRLDVQGGQINSAGGLCIAGDCKTAWSQVGGGGSSQWTTSGSNIYYNTGNVGIGTAAPSASYKLDVNGGVNASGNINATGNITAAGNIAAKYQDVAEWVHSSQELPAGTVVVLDQTKSNQVIASSQAYDTRVAGVISLQPGIALGENGAGKVLVATTGRVRIKVDASRGSIQVGDLLVTSDLAGVAMKSQPIDVGGVQIHRPGTLIGKALEPLEKGTGEILVLLSLQ